MHVSDLDFKVNRNTFQNHCFIHPPLLLNRDDELRMFVEWVHLMKGLILINFFRLIFFHLIYHLWVYIAHHILVFQKLKEILCLEETSIEFFDLVLISTLHLEADLDQIGVFSSDKFVMVRYIIFHQHESHICDLICKSPVNCVVLHLVI